MFDFEKGPIKLILGGKYPHCHTVFVDDQKSALIDAASKENTLRALDQRNPVKILLVSHGHEDHIMYNYLFPHAAFWVPEADAHVFLSINNLLDCYSPTDEERVQWEHLLLEQCHYEARKADRLLKDGDMLEFGRTRCRVIHTPGHTPGHCAFHFPEEKVLFLADMDLVKAGPYYGDVASSIEQSLDSLERLAAIDVEVYLTSHGKGIHDGDPDQIHRFAACIQKREDTLLEFLAQGPKTLEDVTQRGIIYGPPRVVAGWDLSISERSMMSKHLKRLEKQCRATLEAGRYGLLE